MSEHSRALLAHPLLIKVWMSKRLEMAHKSDVAGITAPEISAGCECDICLPPTLVQVAPFAPVSDLRDELIAFHSEAVSPEAA